MRETFEPPKKKIGRVEDPKMDNAMQVALKRYEKELELKKLQKNTDLKWF